MRKLMAAEKAEAAARGEVIDETSEDEGVDDFDDEEAAAALDTTAMAAAAEGQEHGVAAAAAAAAAVPAMTAMGLQLGESEEEGRVRKRSHANGGGASRKSSQHNRPLRDPELDRLSDWDRDHRLDDFSGNEADADDTSIDSRTSSRIMGESIDSLGHMYESEYDNQQQDIDLKQRDLKLLPGGEVDLGRLNSLAGAAQEEESDFFQEEDEGKKEENRIAKERQGNSENAPSPPPVRELQC